MTARLPDNVLRLDGAGRRPDAPSLIAGDVMHRRTRPAANAFSYPAFCLRLPLSGLARLAEVGIALNARGLVSFHERDHGPRDGSSLDAWIRALLAREGVRADGDVVLYAFPRMLGYVFNPVSFWVCHAGDGTVRAVLVEVNNTFGESHQYLLARDDGAPLASGQTFRARKEFHVSPFCAVRGHYTFRFHFGPGRWLARIDYFEPDDAHALLETHVSGIAEPLPARGPLPLFWRYRWFTLGVVARIHWQAAKLWFKRVPFFTKPSPPHQPLTRSS